MSWLDGFLAAFRDERRPPVGDPEQIAQVEEVLSELRPIFEADGGDIQLDSIADGRVTVRLRGACAHCSVSDTTLFGALEPRLKERHDWVVAVRAL